MKLSFVPLRSDSALELHRDGDTLRINGTPFDFSPLPEGATLPCDAIDSPWFAGPVERREGRLHLRLFLPHGASATAAQRQKRQIEAADNGPVILPGQEGGQI